MLDIGWMELVVIGAVALIVVGPKELPGMFRTAGQYLGKARGMAREFQRSMEQAAEQSGMNEATRELRSLNRMNMGSPGDRGAQVRRRSGQGHQGRRRGAAARGKPAKAPAGTQRPSPAAEPASASAAEPQPPSQQTPS